MYCGHWFSCSNTANKKILYILQVAVLCSHFCNLLCERGSQQKPYQDFNTLYTVYSIQEYSIQEYSIQEFSIEEYST